MSHERVIRYVNKNYGGDWKRYIVRWEGQLKVMVDIYDRNSTAIVKKRGVKLSGDKLGKYIDAIIKRISITRCLAGQATGRKAKPGRG